MRKKLVLLIVSFILCMPTFAARKKKDNTTKSETAEVVNATNTQLKFNILTDSTAEVINDDSYWSLISIEVPEKVRIADNIFTVTSVGSKAFEDCQNLTNVKIQIGRASCRERV